MRYKIVTIQGGAMSVSQIIDESGIKLIDIDVNLFLKNIVMALIV